MAGEYRDRGTLGRIAALLLSLAFLAERAAGRSFPVRFLVLIILFRAEAVACAFVAGMTGADCLDEPPANGGGAIDAEMLALRLRMLAAVLGMLANADGDCEGWMFHPNLTPRPSVLLLVSLPANRFRRPLQPYDTS